MTKTHTVPHRCYLWDSTISSNSWDCSWSASCRMVNGNVSYWLLYWTMCTL